MELAVVIYNLCTAGFVAVSTIGLTWGLIGLIEDYSTRKDQRK